MCFAGHAGVGEAGKSTSGRIDFNHIVPYCAKIFTPWPVNELPRDEKAPLFLLVLLFTKCVVKYVVQPHVMSQRVPLPHLYFSKVNH